ncbi:hypothetical protein [Alteribacter aurantiacus]|uniref:hypothetical protein n=1 Tax=Alteribacter aurantiacus TaxID=254410 RepID=UPI000424A43B|nr:hypothetical protein [Alteribacter aurantiacus]
MKNAWSKKDDLTLSTCVLKAMENGHTQLSAFEEAGKMLNRSSGACGFRWNSSLRKQYEKEITQVKAMKKKKCANLSTKNVPSSPEHNDVTVDHILKALSNFNKHTPVKHLSDTSLLDENQRLKEENKELKLQLHTLQTDLASVYVNLDRLRRFMPEEISDKK